MTALFQDPLILGMVAPFFIAFGLAAILRFGLGVAMGPRFAVFAVGLAFLATYVLLLGTPPHLPRTSMQKIFHLAAIGLIAGVVIDATRTERAAGHLLSYIFPAVAIVWLGWPLLTSGPSAGDMVTMLALYAGSILVLWRVAATGRAADVAADARHALSPTIMVLVAATSAGVVAVIGASASLSQLVLALALAAGGYLIWNYGAYLRHGQILSFGATGAFGVAGVLLVLLYVMALFAERVSRWALLVLALVFVADLIVRQIAFKGYLRHVFNPVLYGILLALPAVLSILVAIITTDTSSGY